MNEETREFLLECKKAGYEFVTIGVEDKRVPISKRIEKLGDKKYHKTIRSFGVYWGGINRVPTKVVCATPNRHDSGRPAIWDICKNSPLTAGLGYGGCGCGESHEIRPNHPLERGCYDLKQLS
jgi:hypothetical protein